MIKTNDKYFKKHESNRLYFRKLKIDDYAVWKKFFENKDAIQYFPVDNSSSEEKAKKWINKQLNRYKNIQFGLQAIIHKKTNKFIGQSGLLTQIVEGKQEIEVAFHILPEYWGNGFAPEAGKFFIDFAFENDITNSIISIIDIRNIKSQKATEKNGLVIDKQIKWNNFDVYIYRINK